MGPQTPQLLWKRVVKSPRITHLEGLLPFKNEGTFFLFLSSFPGPGSSPSNPISKALRQQSLSCSPHLPNAIHGERKNALEDNSSANETDHGDFFLYLLISHREVSQWGCECWGEVKNGTSWRGIALHCLILGNRNFLRNNSEARRGRLVEPGKSLQGLGGGSFVLYKCTWQSQLGSIPCLSTIVGSSGINEWMFPRLVQG